MRRMSRIEPISRGQQLGLARPARSAVVARSRSRSGRAAEVGLARRRRIGCAVAGRPAAADARRSARRGSGRATTPDGASRRRPRRRSRSRSRGGRRGSWWCRRSGRSPSARPVVGSALAPSSREDPVAGPRAADARRRSAARTPRRPRRPCRWPTTCVAHVRCAARAQPLEREPGGLGGQVAARAPAAARARSRPLRLEPGRAPRARRDRCSSRTGSASSPSTRQTWSHGVDERARRCPTPRAIRRPSISTTPSPSIQRSGSIRKSIPAIRRCSRQQRQHLLAPVVEVCRQGPRPTCPIRCPRRSSVVVVGRPRSFSPDLNSSQAVVDTPLQGIPIGAAS